MNFSMYLKNIIPGFFSLAPFLILISFMATSPFRTVNAQTVYVDASNNTGVEDGTQSHPFDTPEEGMNKAIAGQTLFIRNGTYTPAGGIFYLKPGVRLTGESSQGTLINGSLKDTTYSNLAARIEKIAFTDYIFWRPALIAGQIVEKSLVTDCKCRSIQIAHGGGFTDPSRTYVAPIPYFHITGNVVDQSITFSFGQGMIVGENVVSGNKAGSIGLNHGYTEFTNKVPLPASGYLIENNEVTGELFFRQGGTLRTPIIVRNNKAQSLNIKSGGGFIYTLTGNTLQEGYFDSSGANRTLFSGNTILNGRISDSSGGWGEETEDAVIENNTITYKYVAGQAEEVVSVKSSSVTLRNNVISGEGPLSGIIINSGSPTHITGNKIILNKGVPVKNTFGIQTSAGKGYVTGNEISGAWMGYYSSSGAILFSQNLIKKCHTGFYSKGTEEVTGNVITQCSGNGMILNGLKGPITGNTITGNDSTGIWVIKTVDIGGGNLRGAGRNILRGNGYYDLRISTVNPNPDTLFINNNVWDHNSIADVMKYDILNESTNPALVIGLQSIVALPGLPAHLLPANLAVITTRQATLTWENVAGADSFRIQISTVQDFKSVVTDTVQSGGITNLTRNFGSNPAYYWRVKAKNLAGEGEWSATRKFTVAVAGTNGLSFSGTMLYQNHPNPVRTSTTLSYSLARPGKVKITICDITGRILMVSEDYRVEGSHRIEWIPPVHFSGVCFCTLESGEFIQTIRMYRVK